LSSSMQEEVVYSRQDGPLIILERHAVNIPDEVVEASLKEIFSRTGLEGEFRSGYLLGVEDKTGFPLSTQLLALLESGIVPCDFTFSFLKGHAGTPPIAQEGVYFEGPHLDSHPALGDSIELLRVLVNLSPHSRKFKYFLTDSFELEKRGIPIGKREFVPLTVPSDTAEQVVEIPGRTSTEVCALRFWASVVPHVGVNMPEGSFLASFESPRPYRCIASVGSKYPAS
jgi:hypothetical protein